MLTCPLCVVFKGRFELVRQSKHQLDIQYAFDITVLPLSGDLVVLGQAAREQEAFYVFALQDGKLVKRRSVKRPCQRHHGALYCFEILGLVVQRQELIAACCDGCSDIKLVDPKTGSATTAYEGKRLYFMCHGARERLWVKEYDKNTVFELNCSIRTFSETGRSVTFRGMGEKSSYSVCYLSTNDALAAGAFDQDTICAYQCSTESLLWKINDGQWGYFFCPEHDVLLAVSDVRAHLMDPSNGDVLQTIRNEASFTSVCWCKNQLVTVDNKKCTNFFTLHQSNSVSSLQPHSVRYPQVSLLCVHTSIFSEIHTYSFENKN